MANRFPLVIDTTDGNKLKELPAGDNLDLRESSIVRVQNVTALGTIDAADITVNGNRLVAQNFIDLTDTPTNYINAANKFLKVNDAGTAVEFRAFSDIGDIVVDNVEVSEGITVAPSGSGTANIGTDDNYFNRVTANEFKGDLIDGNNTRVFDASTGFISYAALQGAPTQISEFNNDIGYLLAADLDASLAGLFDEGSTFDTDIKGSVFGDDSTMIVDGIASEIVGVVNNTTITTVNLTAITSIATTAQANTFRGPADSNVAIDAQNDYDIHIGENNTGATVIFNGEADNFDFGRGTGFAEYNASTDLILRAGNRILFANTPVRFSQLTDAEAAFIVAQNGDVIYNTVQNRLQIRQNGAWVDLHKGTFDGNVTTAAGTSNFNDVVIAGDLTVQGTTTSIETTNTDITDNVITLNKGELGAGVTLTTSGIEVDRGTSPNRSLVWTENFGGKWIVTDDATFFADRIEANYLFGSLTVETDNLVMGDGDITATGTLTVGGGELVQIVSVSTDIELLPVGKVKIDGNLEVTGNTTFTGGVEAAAFKGTFVGDDSAVLIDGNNNKVVGDVSNTEIVTTTIQGRASANLNIYRGVTGTVTVGDASSGSLSVSDSGINITATAGVDINGAASGTVDIGTGATTGNVTIGKVGNTTTINGTLNAALTGDVTGDVDGNVTGNIDNTALTVGATATTIAIGNATSTTTVNGDLQLNNALIVNNLVADDSISITTATGDGNAISLGPQGTNTAINLTANSIRLFGPVTTSIAAQGGIVGDLKGSVVADDSTVIIDSVSGTVYKANIQDSGNWDTAFSWGNHATAGYITSGGEFTGDVKGSVFADDSSVMVNAVDFTMFSDVMNLTPLNAEPANLISGMLVAADGTTWDPASKAGAVSYPVFYDGAAWNALY